MGDGSGREARDLLPPDLQCSALHSRKGTGPDLELMTELTAQARDLSLCEICWTP